MSVADSSSGLGGGAVGGGTGATLPAGSRVVEALANALNSTSGSNDKDTPSGNTHRQVHSSVSEKLLFIFSRKRLFFQVKRGQSGAGQCIFEEKKSASLKSNNLRLKCHYFRVFAALG